MANLLNYISEGDRFDFTAPSAMTGGYLFDADGIPLVTSVPIASGALGSVAAKGTFDVPYVGNACNAGDNIWWDTNGTPYGGAADGAATNLGADGNLWIGVAAEDASANAAMIKVALSQTNPEQPAWVGRTFFKSAIDITMVEATHSGGVIEITADAKTVTLPTGVVGMEYIIVNRVVDAGALLTVDLDGNEIIRGANLTIAATKTANNTKATAVQGDWLHLVCTVAATAWRCVGKRGIWVTS
jgi:predicted RecA/RadA family phage recombinase